MSSFKFKPSDFDFEPDSNMQDVIEQAAEQANAALAAHLETCMRVYLAMSDDTREPIEFCSNYVDKQSNMTALLFNMEPLASKPCEHEPEKYYEGTCKHCGVKLKLAWEPCE